MSKTAPPFCHFLVCARPCHQRYLGTELPRAMDDNLPCHSRFLRSELGETGLIGLSASESKVISMGLPRSDGSIDTAVVGTEETGGVMTGCENPSTSCLGGAEGDGNSAIAG